MTNETTNAPNTFENLDALGFRPPPTILDAGTGDRSIEKYQRKRDEFNKLPRILDAAGNIVSTVRAENREDHVMTWGDFFLNTRGQLARVTDERKLDSSNAIDLEARAFQQLCAKLCALMPDSNGEFGSIRRYVNNLMHAPRHLRVRDFNWLIANLAELDKNRTVVMRTRNGVGRRSAYAAVSEGYTAIDADLVAEVMIDTLREEGCRAEGSYNGYDMALRALWMSDIAPRTGDTFKSGIEVRTSDHGGGSIIVQAVAFRAKCSNMDLINKRVVKLMSQVHRGSIDAIRDFLRKAIRNVRNNTGRFFELYGQAAQERVARTEDDVKDIFHRLAARKIDVRGQQTRVEPVLTLPHVKPDMMSEILLGSWGSEPGFTRADVYNAVTHAAHNHSWDRLEARSELEEQAAKVLIPKLQLVNN